MIKFKRILAALLIPALLPTVLLTSCEKDSGTKVNEPTLRSLPPLQGTPIKEDFTERMTNFSEYLFRLSLEKGKNLVISPLSVTYALSLTANGASNKTLAEFEALNSGITVAQMNDYLWELTHRMAQTKESTVQIANSVWTNAEHFTVNEDFRALAQQYYGAEASALDFTKKQSADTINKWVSDHTDGMIDKAVDQIDPFTAMILINTILFDGKWDVPYGEHSTIPLDFNGYSTKTDDADFLHSKEHTYFEVKDGVGFSKAYKDGYKFVAILPNEGVDVYDFASDLDIPAAIASSKTGLGEVICRIPKFEYGVEVDLNEILQKMGLKRAFSPAEAELEKLGTSTVGSLYISKVLQKAKIKLDENGTKAAAMTGVFVYATSAAPIVEPKEITLDRPFVYMIVDTANDLPLFMGVLADLEG